MKHHKADDKENRLSFGKDPAEHSEEIKQKTIEAMGNTFEKLQVNSITPA